MAFLRGSSNNDQERTAVKNGVSLLQRAQIEPGDGPSGSPHIWQMLGLIICVLVTQVRQYLSPHSPHPAQHGGNSISMNFQPVLKIRDCKTQSSRINSGFWSRACLLLFTLPPEHPGQS